MIKHLSDLKPPHRFLLQASLYELHRCPGDIDLVGVLYLLIDYFNHIADSSNLKWWLTEE